MSSDSSRDIPLKEDKSETKSDCLKYKRKITAGPERTTKASDVNCAITFQLIIC